MDVLCLTQSLAYSKTFKTYRIAAIALGLLQTCDFSPYSLHDKACLILTTKKEKKTHSVKNPFQLLNLSFQLIRGEAREVRWLLICDPRVDYPT